MGWQDKLGVDAAPEKGGWQSKIGLSGADKKEDKPEDEMWGKKVDQYIGKTISNIPKNVASIGKGLYELGEMAIDPRKRIEMAKTLGKPGVPTAIGQKVVSGAKEFIEHPVESTMSYVQEHPLDAAMLLSGGLGAAGKASELAGAGKTAGVLKSTAELVDPISGVINASGNAYRGVKSGVTNMLPSNRVGRTLAEERALADPAAVARASELERLTGTQMSEAERLQSPTLMAAQRDLSRSPDKIGGISPATVLADKKSSQLTGLGKTIRSTRGAGDAGDVSRAITEQQVLLEDNAAAATKALEETTTKTGAALEKAKSRLSTGYNKLMDKWIRRGGSVEDLAGTLENKRTALELDHLTAEELAASELASQSRMGEEGGNKLRGLAESLKTSLTKQRNAQRAEIGNIVIEDQYVQGLADGVEDVAKTISALGEQSPALTKIQTRLARSGAVPEAKGGLPTTPEAAAEYLDNLKNAAAAAASAAQPITVGDIDALKKSIGKAISKTSDENQRRILLDAQQKVLKVEDSMIEGSKAGAEIEKLKAVRKWEAEEYYPIFGRDRAGRPNIGRQILDEKSGDYRILSTKLKDRFAPTAPEALPEAIRQFERMFGNSPEAKSALLDAFRSDLANKTQGDASKIQGWLTKNKAALDGYGFGKEFGSVQSAIEEANKGKTLLAEYNKSQAGKLIGMDLDRAVPKILSQNRASEYLADLKRLASEDTTGSALKGLQRSVSETILGKKGLDQKRALDAARRSGLYAKTELRSLEHAVKHPETAEKLLGAKASKAEALVKGAKTEAEIAASELKSFNRSEAAKLIGIPEADLGEKLLVDRKKMAAALSATAGNPTARAGLKAAVSDTLESIVGGIELSNDGQIKNAVTKIGRMRKLAGKQLTESGLFSPQELKRFDAVYDYLKQLRGANLPKLRSVEGTKGIFEAFARAGGYGAKMVTGRLGAYPIGKEAVRWLEKVFEGRIDYHMTRALYDPEYADKLVGLVTDVAKSEPGQYAQLAKKYGTSLGIAASTTADNKIPEPEPQPEERRKNFGQ